MQADGSYHFRPNRKLRNHSILSEDCFADRRSQVPLGTSAWLHAVSHGGREKHLPKKYISRSYITAVVS